MKTIDETKHSLLEWLSGRIVPERCFSIERGQELIALLREISVDDARAVAAWVTQLWASDPETYGDAEPVLLGLSCSFPGSLTGLHQTLLDGETFVADQAFRDADAGTRDRLIRTLEEDPNEPDALRRLAYIGDEVVQAQFHRWRQSPPGGCTHIATEIDSRARDAGWELTAEGGRRDLFHVECYQLVPHDQALGGEAPGPASVVAPHEESCGWCGRQLTTLFDIDLRDSRLTFLAPGWNHLRVAMCERCTGFGTVFTEVDGRGCSRWSSRNRRPDYIGDGDSAWDFPKCGLVLGRRRSPFEAHPDLLDLPGGGSQLGGFWMWMGEEPHPDCPKCGRAMGFVGQLQTTDAFGEVWDGTTYAWLCQDCGMAATTYAQT
jgi:hypothetical protein